CGIIAVSLEPTRRTAFLFVRFSRATHRHAHCRKGLRTDARRHHRTAPRRPPAGSRSGLPRTARRESGRPGGAASLGYPARPVRRYAEALTLVERAIARDGERAVFQHTLGEMQLHAGE